MIGRIYMRLGDMARDHKKPEAAIPWFEQARDKLDALFQQNPQRADTREGLRNVYWAWAGALGELDRHAEAVKKWDLVLAWDAGRYKNQIRLHRATAQARAGDYADALKGTDAVLAGEPKNAAIFYNAALVYAVAASEVGKDEKLGEAERKPLTERYAARCVALLTEASAAGYFRDARDLRKFHEERAFNPLRSRPDFKVFLQTLAETTKPPRSQKPGCR
jgi:tetratricopeptide (TPR) repeat protein